MNAYNKAYLDEITENQGKLFDLVAMNYPDKDTKEFIKSYMKSTTRKNIDNAQAYLCTMDAKELWHYYNEHESAELPSGTSLKGFLPDWIGEFYAYYQWYYNIPSAVIVDKIPIEYLETHYAGLHDLDLSLAVQKVGAIQ